MQKTPDWQKAAKRLLMKAKEGSARAGLHSNIKTKVTNTEEIENLKTAKEDTDTGKDFAHPGSAVNSNADGSQEITRGLRF